MSATIASIAALESGSRRPVLPPTGSNPLIELAELEEMPVALGNGGGNLGRVPGVLGRDPRHALEDGVQPRHAATADVHLAQEQIRQHAHQRDRDDDHHPCDPGRRVAMGPKQDPRDDRQLEQRDKGDTEQRVLKRGDHARVPDAGNAACYPTAHVLARKSEYCRQGARCAEPCIRCRGERGPRGSISP